MKDIVAPHAIQKRTRSRREERAWDPLLSQCTAFGVHGADGPGLEVWTLKLVHTVEEKDSADGLQGGEDKSKIMTVRRAGRTT